MLAGGHSIATGSVSIQATPKSPFLLANEAEYQRWREQKLRSREQLDASRCLPLKQSRLFDEMSLVEARRQVEAFGFVLFEAASAFGKSDFLTLNQQLGLIHIVANPGSDEDSVTSLQMLDQSDRRARYIPYTNRGLNWHTDGYYNAEDQRINAFALYCEQAAESGGENFLLDHEMLYLLLRDAAPDLVEALMADDLMAIPANLDDQQALREVTTGPVFSVEPISGLLNMRYTSRPGNIQWKQDQLSQQALQAIREILSDENHSVRLRLASKQGLICRNILHGRSAFDPDLKQSPRLLYRARYFDAIRTEA